MGNYKPNPFMIQPAHLPPLGAGRVIIGTLIRGKYCSIIVAFWLLYQEKQSAENIYIYIYIGFYYMDFFL